MCNDEDQRKIDQYYNMMLITMMTYGQSTGVVSESVPHENQSGTVSNRQMSNKTIMD